MGPEDRTRDERVHDVPGRVRRPARARLPGRLDAAQVPPRAIDDLHAMLKAHGDWMDLGAADEQKDAKPGTVEAWGRDPSNPVGGWYGLRKGYRGRFGDVHAAAARGPRARRADARRQGTTGCGPRASGECRRARDRPRARAAAHRARPSASRTHRGAPGGVPRGRPIEAAVGRRGLGDRASRSRSSSSSPWDGTLVRPGAARRSDAARVVGAAADGAAPRRSARHGDAVTGPDATVAGHAGAERRRSDAAPRRCSTGYLWPIAQRPDHERLRSGRPSSFSRDGESFHDGIDVASFCGARITAAHDGVVLGAGRRTQASWAGSATSPRSARSSMRRKPGARRRSPW